MVKDGKLSSDTNEPTYPLCNKWKSVRPQADTLLEFMEWLDGKGIRLCKTGDEEWQEEYFPIFKSHTNLLYEFFEIDAQKLDDERRDILEKQRELSEKNKE